MTCNKTDCPLYNLHKVEVGNLDVFNTDKIISSNKQVNRHRKVEPEISPNEKGEIDVLFVHEAPGAEEDWENRPLVGRAGRLFREYARKILIEFAYGLTNLVLCRPEKNKMPTVGSKKWDVLYENCFPYLLELIKKYKPKIVVTGGNHATAAFLKHAKITKQHGGLYLYNENDIKVVVIPIYHPSYLLRRQNKQIEEEYKQDLEMIYNILKEKKPILDLSNGVITYKNIDNLIDKQVFEDMLRDFLEAKVISVDIETKNLSLNKETNKILSIGYAIDTPEMPNKAISFPFNDTFLQYHERLLTSNNKKLFHNGWFDIKYIKYLTGIDVNNYSYDTMYMLYLLNSPRKDLKSNITKYFTAIRWEDEMIYEDMEQVDLDLLLKYNATDAVATLMLFKILYKNIKDKGLDYIHKIMVKATYPILEMEINGVKVDREGLLKLKEELEANLYRLEFEIKDLPEIQEYADIKKKMVVDEVIKKLPKIQKEYVAHLSENKFNEWLIQNKNILEKAKINLNSVEDVKQILKYVYKVDIKRIIDELSYNIKDRKSDEVVDKFILQHLANEGNMFAKLLLEYRKIYKFLNTYIKPASTYRQGDTNTSRAWLSKDHYIYTKFNLTGTVTGRIASSNPNMQNIPRGSAIKKYFISRYEDGFIINADFKQIEFWAAFMLAKDAKMLKVYSDIHADIHKMVASMALNKPQSEITKEERTHIKTIGFGLLYGRGPISIANSLGITEKEAVSLTKKFFAAMPEIDRLIKYQYAYARQHGLVRNPFGRIRLLIDALKYSKKEKKTVEENAKLQAALRRAINTPVQSFAFDTVLHGIIQLYEKMKMFNMRSKLIITVHDSIVIDTPNDELWDMTYLLLTTLNDIKFPEFLAKEYPIQYKPRIDIEFGHNYKEQVKVTEYLGFEEAKDLPKFKIQDPNDMKRKVEAYYERKGYKRVHIISA